MTYLSRDDVLKADDLEIVDVDVPEWGGIVRVRALSGTARDAYDASLVRMGTNGQPLRDRDGEPVMDITNRRAKLIVLAVVNDDGDPLFSLADVAALGAKSGVALERVADAIERLSGMNDEAVEDAEGNSEAAPGGISVSS